MILVSGTLDLAPGARDGWLAESLVHIQAARATPGCHSFTVAPDPIEPHRVVVHELWADRATLDAFRGSGPSGELASAIRSANIQEVDLSSDREGADEPRAPLTERRESEPSQVRVACFTVSADGFGAGEHQDLARPMGKGTEALHAWFFETQTFKDMVGLPGGSVGTADMLAKRGFENVGAWVMGRNMFTHERGPWLDESWKGWWGDVPPYRCDVFVLTHHPRPPLEHGGTTFHFVTDGLPAAVARAREAAGPGDVRIGGGVSTVRAAFRAGLIDEAHIVVSPILVGRGESLWSELDLPALGYAVQHLASTGGAAHLLVTRSSPKQG